MLLKKPLHWLHEYGEHLLVLAVLFLAAVGVQDLLSMPAPHVAQGEKKKGLKVK
jgi:hypothetical protein